MPKFTFTSPEGKTYDVEGPGTKEQAFQILQQQLQSVPQAPKQDYNRIPGSSGLDSQRNLNKPDNTSMMDRVKGYGDAALTMGTNAAGMTAGMIQAPIERAFGMNKGSTEKRIFDIADHYTWSPRTAQGRETLEQVGELADKSKLQGAVGLPLNELGQLSRAGAVEKNAAHVGMSKAGQVARNVASKVPIGVKIDPEVKALAIKAKEFGIDLRPDMLTDNKFARIFGEAMDQVPASGSKEKDRLLSFNRALVRQIGGDETTGKLTPKVFNKAIQKSGTEVGRFYKKSQIDGEALVNGLIKVEETIGQETADNASILRHFVDQASGLINRANGKINGIALRKLDSKIGARIRSSTDGDLRSGLQEIQEALRDSLNKGLSAEDVAALHDARTRYAKAITLEPLVAKAKRGMVNPSLLLGQMTSTRKGKAMMARGKAGDMGDLARIGSEFLTGPGSSNTSERGAIYKGLGYAGAGAAGVAATMNAINPLAVGGIYGLANLYNRVGPYLIPKK